MDGAAGVGQSRAPEAVGGVFKLHRVVARLHLIDLPRILEVDLPACENRRLPRQRIVDRGPKAGNEPLVPDHVFAEGEAEGRDLRGEDPGRAEPASELPRAPDDEGPGGVRLQPHLRGALKEAAVHHGAVVAPELAFEVEADGEAVAEILSAFEPPTVGRVGAGVHLDVVSGVFARAVGVNALEEDAGVDAPVESDVGRVGGGAKPATAEIAEATVAVRSLWRMVMMMVSGLWCVGV